MRVLQRGLSDHTPLFVESGEAAHVGNETAFFFWTIVVREDGFLELVASE